MNFLKNCHFRHLLFTTLILTATLCKATEQANFAAGLKAYDEKNFVEAEKSFRESLSTKKNSPAILYNLALALIEQKKTAEARGFLRKAQLLEPNNDIINQTLIQLNQKFPMNPIPQKLSLFESFRIHILEAASISSFHYLFAFSFFAFAWMWIQVIGKKSKAKKTLWQDLITVPVLIMSILFMFVSILYISKLSLSFEKRGILIVPSESVKLAADDKAAELLTLNAGLEFTIEQQQNEWLQITYAGTSTGWVKSGSVLVISGDSND